MKTSVVLVAFGLSTLLIALKININIFLDSLKKT